MAIEIGKKAPLFTLQKQDGEKVALKDLAGEWVVLYFYPKDDTPGCTTEACEFTDSIKDFQNIGARVFGVSPDSIESHQRFIDKHNLQVDLLSDSKLTAMPKYEAYGEKNQYGRKTMGVIRSTVIIDPDGKVAHRWKRVQAKGHAEKVKAKLQELQAS